MPAALTMLIRALIVWALFILLEAAQGTLRRAVYGVDVPMLIRQVSVGVGVLMIVLLAWFSCGWLRLRSQAAALAVGALWVVLTLVFEALVGALTTAPWALAADYDPRQGGLMAFGMVAIAFAPWLVQRLRGAHRSGRPVDPPQGPRRAREVQSPR